MIVQANALVFAGNDDGRVYALEGGSGALKWRYQTGSAIACTPTVASGTVYIGSNDQWLYALEAETGRLKWRSFLSGKVALNPTVAAGKVFVPIQIPNSGCYSNFFVLDTANGNVLQQVNKGHGFNTAVTYAGGKLYCGTLGYGIFCLDAGTLNQLWRYDFGIIIGNPAIAGGRVFAGGEGVVVGAVDAAIGALIWQIGGQFGSTDPTLDGATVFTTRADTLYAFDAANGNRNWAVAKGYTSPLADAGTVYTSGGNGNGWLYALDGSAGGLKWQWRASTTLNEGYLKPTLANGTLYTNSASGRVYAVDAGTGLLRWTYNTGKAIQGGIAVMDAKGQEFHPTLSGHRQ